MLQINDDIFIPDGEIQLDAIRSQGAGGQNVNKVSSAIHLRFDIAASSLPREVKQRLSRLADRRISDKGVVVIKAQRFRTREKNLKDAYVRLKNMILLAVKVPRNRIATRPSRASKQRRMEDKSKRGKLKQLRGKVE
jgi:ribosome-associated protein